MIGPLRRRHFRLFLVLGLALVLLWFASLAARQPVGDYVGQIPGRDTEARDSDAP